MYDCDSHSYFQLSTLGKIGAKNITDRMTNMIWNMIWNIHMETQNMIVLVYNVSAPHLYILQIGDSTVSPVGGHLLPWNKLIQVHNEISHHHTRHYADLHTYL